MAWRDATVGQGIVDVSNGALRAAQIVTGILTIHLYANEKGWWPGCGMPGKFVRSWILISILRLTTWGQNYEFVLGSLCIVTGLVLGVIPFKMSYRPVALAAPWDGIMFFLYW